MLIEFLVVKSSKYFQPEVDLFKNIFEVPLVHLASDNNNHYEVNNANNNNKQLDDKKTLSNPTTTSGEHFAK